MVASFSYDLRLHRVVYKDTEIGSHVSGTIRQSQDPMTRLTVFEVEPCSLVNLGSW